MTLKLIKLNELNELRTENEQFVMKSCLVNADKIVSIQSGKLSKKGPHIEKLSGGCGSEAAQHGKETK